MPFSKGEAQKLAQIEGLSSQVAVNVQALVAYSRSSPWEPSSFAQGWDGVGQPGHPPTLHAPDEASHARRSILTNLGQLQVLLEQPADFLQRLARQVCTVYP
jgi:hypothetical protein